MIYFIQAGDRPFVKVGFANNVQARITLLQCGCPDAYRLIGAIEGDRLLEASIHLLFATSRHRGEWFHLSPEVERSISSLIASDDPLGALASMFPKRPDFGDRAVGIAAQSEFFTAVESEMGLTPYGVAKRAGLHVSTVVGWSKGCAMPAWAIGHLGKQASISDDLLSILSRPWKRRIAGVARRAAA